MSIDDPTSTRREDGELVLYHRARRSVADTLLRGGLDDPDGRAGAEIAGIELHERPPPPPTPQPQGEGEAAGAPDTVLLEIRGLRAVDLAGHETPPRGEAPRSWAVPAELLRERASVRELGER